MNSIAAYMILGVSLAAPIGPVNAAMLDTGIKNGFFHAWMLGMGALTADVLYMIMVYLGIGQMIEFPLVKIILWLFGCFVLIYTGVESLLSIHKITLLLKFGKEVRLRRSLFSGFLIALLNPLSILFWLGIYGSILAENAGNFSGYQLIINSVAIIGGVLLWDTIIAMISSGARKLVSIRLLKVISIISSLFMIGFGVYFGYQAYQTVF
ncbi:LysE family transporter [Sporosarcina sp. CAU 1771]